MKYLGGLMFQVFFSPSKHKRVADACLFQASVILPLNTNCELLYDRGWHHTRPSPGLRADNGLAPPPSTDLFCSFHFGRDRCQRESVWPMAQEEGKSKRRVYLGAATWNPTPHLHHEFHDELADLALFLTRVTLPGKCQETPLLGTMSTSH